jgi:hypothetical protein
MSETMPLVAHWRLRARGTHVEEAVHGLLRGGFHKPISADMLIVVVRRIGTGRRMGLFAASGGLDHRSIEHGKIAPATQKVR